MLKKTTNFIFIVFLLFVSCRKSEIPQIQQYTIDQFMNTVSIFGSSFSHEEQTILFSSNQTGIYNAYTLPVQGGEPTPLTTSTEDAIFALSFFPHDNRILYSSDKGGNEITHIYLRNEDGTVKDLTPGEKARAGFYGWSFDEKSFFFGSNEREPRFMDIYEMDITTFAPQMVYQNDEGYELGAISRDQRYFAFVKPIATSNIDMYLYDNQTKEMKHLSPHEGDVNYTPQDFSPDSKSLYFTTDVDSEFTYLKRYDIETGQSETIEKADWDIWYSYFSRNGKYRVVGINEDAQTAVNSHIILTHNSQIAFPDFSHSGIGIR